MNVEQIKRDRPLFGRSLLYVMRYAFAFSGWSFLRAAVTIMPMTHACLLYTSCFGIAIANAVKLFDISLVVLGDLPYVENDLFLRTINNVVNDYVPYSRNGKITVRRGTAEEEAYALGGSIFVLDQFFKTPKLRLNVQ